MAGSSPAMTIIPRGFADHPSDYPDRAAISARLTLG